jgi:hypothetical protein
MGDGTRQVYFHTASGTKDWQLMFATSDVAIETDQRVIIGPLDDSSDASMYDITTKQNRGLRLSANNGAYAKIEIDGGTISIKDGTLDVLTSVIKFSNLPTSDPSVANQLWNDSGTLKVSAG